jgi:hypothetical protein
MALLETNSGDGDEAVVWDQRRLDHPAQADVHIIKDIIAQNVAQKSLFSVFLAAT